MATAQEQADAAYREYQRQLTNLQNMGSPSSKAYQRQQQLVEATAAASRQANDALVATYSETPAPAGGRTQEEIDAAIRDEQRAYEEKLRAEQRAREQRQIAETVKAVFSQFGLSSLNSVIDDYARKDYSAASIEIMLRQTSQYKQRFPAMEALAAKNRAITEAEYIDYERTAASLERQYGLPATMLTGRVTDLLTNEVSASEMNDRVVLAASAAIQAPEDFRQTMRDYYDIDTGGLTAYFLDPQVATPLLEKQYASSLIGVEARRQGVGIDVYGAENLQELGISQDEARTGFGRVARSEGLTAGRGDVVTQQQLIGGTFGVSQQDTRALERAQASRVGRFQQGGGVVSERKGITGAGTAATR
jgi:hypothetical protein